MKARFDQKEVPDDVDKTPDDAPSVVHREVDLCSELGRLEVLGSENNVARGILHAVTGDVTESCVNITISNIEFLILPSVLLSQNE